MKKLIFLFVFLLSIATATAISISSPSESYTYDTLNILFNASNDNIENSTLCNISYNSVVTNYDFDSNESYSYFLTSPSPTNIVEIECDDNTTTEVVYYYSILEENNDFYYIIALCFAFAIFILFAIVIFKTGNG